MDPIRPTLTPNLQPQPTRPVDGARAAAQKAFFELALGKPAAPAQTTAPTATAQVATTPAAVAQPAPRSPAPGDSTGRPLRPGSLLDIRV